MNSVQYEELCRHFLAQTVGLPVARVSSKRIANPKRGDLPQYGHQIDLWWETGDEVCRYINIANAKWRAAGRIKQGEVLLLQKVKEEVSAHKAVMLTNRGFTSGAQAAAKDGGIALHIVQPTLDVSVLDPKDRTLIQSQLQELASSGPQAVFQHQVVHKAFDLAESASTCAVPRQAVQPPYSTKVVTRSGNKSVGGYSHKGGALGGGQVGGSGGGPVTKGGGGYGTK